MCHRGKMPEGFMSFKTFRKCFESGIPYSIKLNWRGEPLLHPRLPRFIDYAKKIGVLEVSINTNGLLLTRPLIEKLNDAKLDWLIISIDGATKKTYESIRHGGNFDRLLYNIKMAWLSAKFKIRIQICPQKENKDELSQWYFLFRHLADELRIGRLHDFGNEKGYNLSIPRKCKLPWRRLTADWQGNIMPCPSDYQGHFRIGHIDNISISKAWHSSRLNHLRWKLTRYGRNYTPPCNKCSAYC